MRRAFGVLVLVALGVLVQCGPGTDPQPLPPVPVNPNDPDGGTVGGGDGGGGGPGGGDPRNTPRAQGFLGDNPWQTTTFGAAQGIRETPIVGVTTDEAENLWVATHRALYLLRP